MKSKFEKKWGLCWANISENYTCILSRILSSNITRGNRGTEIIHFFFKIKKRWILVSDRRRSNGNLSYSKSAKTRTKWPQKRRLEPFIWKKGSSICFRNPFPYTETRGTKKAIRFRLNCPHLNLFSLSPFFSSHVLFTGIFSILIRALGSNLRGECTKLCELN